MDAPAKRNGNRGPLGKANRLLTRLRSTAARINGTDAEGKQHAVELMRAICVVMGKGVINR